MIVVAGYTVSRLLIDPAVSAIESIESAKAGYLGGLGLPDFDVMAGWRPASGGGGLCDW